MFDPVYHINHLWLGISYPLYLECGKKANKTGYVMICHAYLKNGASLSRSLSLARSHPLVHIPFCVILATQLLHLSHPQTT